MGHELALIAAFTTISLFVTAAWVGGYLDPYQKKLQDLALNKMGDNRASYGVKSKSTHQQNGQSDREANDVVGAISAPKTGDKNVDKMQGDLGKDVGGQVGKGGIGEGVGDTLSKGL